MNNIKKVEIAFKAINHKLKKRILDHLETNGESTVTNIYQTLKLEQSVASQHLGLLRRLKIVKTERRGKFIYYSLNQPVLDKMTNLVEELAEVEV